MTTILADKHPHQDERLNTLGSYDILDTGEESDYDDIVALASKICDAPVSLISLVDEDRQWFKARLGFEPRETGLDQSVCSHAILEDDFLEISSMAEDLRTADNPLHIGGPEVKFYAGANLIAPNGLPIGTLCVLDTKPRQLTDFQRQALKTLSRQVMMQLELRKQIRIEAALRSEMDHRVKNSLQTIASILRLSAKRVTDPDALDVLDLVERRLGAVASLHSELMGRDGSSSVEMRSYFEEICALVSAITPDNVKVHFTALQGNLEARKASAIGMIVSEFVANSVKHAFPDNQEGEVTISLTSDADKTWVLQCRDNGIGQRPSSEKIPDSKGLGEMLMESAALQLDGQVENDIGSDGARMTVYFKP